MEFGIFLLFCVKIRFLSFCIVFFCFCMNWVVGCQDFYLIKTPQATSSMSWRNVPLFCTEQLYVDETSRSRVFKFKSEKVPKPKTSKRRLNGLNRISGPEIKVFLSEREETSGSCLTTNSCFFLWFSIFTALLVKVWPVGYGFGGLSLEDRKTWTSRRFHPDMMGFKLRTNRTCLDAGVFCFVLDVLRQHRLKTAGFKTWNLFMKEDLWQENCQKCSSPEDRSKSPPSHVSCCS